MKKVLVTGGAGFIGSHLVERLNNQASFVIALDNFDSYYSAKEKRRNLAAVLRNKKFTLIKGDVRNTSLLENILDTFSPNSIVHLAAKVGARNSLIHPKEYTEVNTLGTLNLLERIKNRKNITLIFASSSSVYGDNKKIPFEEKDIVDNQLSPYAVSKRSAELFCKKYAKLYKIPITCLRFFSVYGPRQRPDLIIRKIIEKILRKETVELYGSGHSARDYTYITDIIDGIQSCLNTHFGFEIINLGNSKPITLLALVALIEKMLNKKARIKYLPPHQADAIITYADIKKAKELLGWHPRVTIRKGLAKLKALYSTT